MGKLNLIIEILDDMIAENEAYLKRMKDVKYELTHSEPHLGSVARHDVQQYEESASVLNEEKYPYK